jgi:hypothetical protein
MRSFLVTPLIIHILVILFVDVVPQNRTFSILMGIHHLSNRFIINHLKISHMGPV